MVCIICLGLGCAVGWVEALQRAVAEAPAGETRFALSVVLSRCKVVKAFDSLVLISINPSQDVLGPTKTPAMSAALLTDEARTSLVFQLAEGYLK